MKNHLTEEQYFKLFILLCQAKDMILRVREKELSTYGSTPAQAAVLILINAIMSAEAYVTPGKVSKWLLREPHTVSKILTRMEDSGLLNKTSGPNNKREVHVTLTEKGEQIYRQSLKREAIKEIMSCLSEEECLQLESLLEKLRDKALHNLHTIGKVPFP